MGQRGCEGPEEASREGTGEVEPRRESRAAEKGRIAEGGGMGVQTAREQEAGPWPRATRWTGAAGPGLCCPARQVGVRAWPRECRGAGVAGWIDSVQPGDWRPRGLPDHCLPYSSVPRALTAPSLQELR